MSTTDQIMELYKDFDKWVSKLSYRVGGKHNAEDVVQEAFTRALKYKGTYDDRRDIEGWFRTILNNATRDFKKEERRNGMVDGDYETDELDNDIFKDEMAGIIFDEIGKLKDLHHDVLRMFVIYGYSAKEIVETVNTSIPNVRKIVHRFKQHMVENYGEGMCS